jgi:arylsulfatase A-like enzyme
MPLTRRSFLQNAAIGSAALALTPKLRSAAPAAPRRPNLLFLMTDQHRADTMPHAGNKVVKAPCLAALAEKSFVFSGTYCCQPVCTPSRGSIFTGLMPHNHHSIDCDINLRKEIPTIAECLPEEYATGFFGKWHLGNELIAQHGFREWISCEDLIHRDYVASSEDLKLRSSYHQFLIKNGFPPDVTDGLDGARLFSFGMQATMAPKFTRAWYLGREAERFLRQRRDGQPFVLTVSIPEPHPPTWGPWNDRHDPDEVPTGPAFGRPIGEGASRLHRRTADRFRLDGYDGHSMDDLAGLRRVRANYYGLVSMVDDALGRVLKALEDSGQADNTIVVYTSDHGDMLGDHGMMGKLVLYEESVRVPLMIHVPWLSNDRVNFDGPFSQVNLMPTLLELMGRDAPAGLDGRSVAQALRKPASWRRQDAVVEWNDWSDRDIDCRSLVTSDGWKLNAYRNDHPELFDLNTDPNELIDLARDPASGGRLRRMAGRLHAWQSDHRDAMPLAV